MNYIPEKRYDFHFAEAIAEAFHNEGKLGEVFENI